jgi:hypothetical protein
MHDLTDQKDRDVNLSCLPRDLTGRCILLALPLDSGHGKLGLCGQEKSVGCSRANHQHAVTLEYKGLLQLGSRVPPRASWQKPHYPPLLRNRWPPFINTATAASEDVSANPKLVRLVSRAAKFPNPFVGFERVLLVTPGLRGWRR